MPVVKGNRTKRIVVFTLFVAVSWVVFLSHRPLPEGVSEPWKTKHIIFFLDSLVSLGNAVESFGFAQRTIFTRELIAFMTWIAPKDHTGLNVTDTIMAGVPVRIYRPLTGETPSGAVVFMHGGGWIIGGKDSHDSVTASIAQRTKHLVIAVEYRMAPEHPYPAAFEDVLAVTKELYSSAELLQVDKKRIALIGDSAGANLAAAVSLKLRDMKHSPMPKLQALFYPMLQAVNFMTSSYIENGYEDKVLGSSKEIAEIALLYAGENPHYSLDVINNNHTTYSMQEHSRHLVDTALIPKQFQKFDDQNVLPTLGNPILADKLWSKLGDPYCMPLMAQNLRNLPTAYVVTSEFDPLRDDGIIYARRLHRSGVKVRWRHYQGAFHGVLAMSSYPLKTASGVQMLNDLVYYLRSYL